MSYPQLFPWWFINFMNWFINKPILLRWSPFQLIFWSSFAASTFSILKKKQLSFTQNLHLSFLSLLTIQLLWELPFNINATISYSLVKQLYVMKTYIIRLVPAMLLIYTLRKFRFHEQVKKRFKWYFLSTLLLTLLVFVIGTWGFIVRFPYAIAYIDILRNMETIK